MYVYGLAERTVALIHNHRQHHTVGKGLKMPQFKHILVAVQCKKHADILIWIEA